MKRIAVALTGPVVCAVFVVALCSSALSADIPKITKDELKSRIEKGDVVVLDVRSGGDWKSSEYRIRSALRENPDDVASWATKYGKDKTLVLYCA